MNSAANKTSAAMPEEFRKMLAQAIDLKNQERYSEAAHILEQLRAENPQSASVHALLGHALWEQNQLNLAVPSFRKAVELSPQSETASLGLFHTLMELGDTRSAIAEMNRFMSIADSEEYKAIKKSIGASIQSAQRQEPRDEPKTGTP
jgi:predicted Zn-dependent protease